MSLRKFQSAFTIRGLRSYPVSNAKARVLCYLLGPLSGGLFLRLPAYSAVWSVRFHAFHAILLTMVWAASWALLRIFQDVSPWFLGTVFRELRLIVNLASVLIWVLLMISAYGGGRFAVIPMVHRLAVRLARRHGRGGPAALRYAR